MPAGRPSDYRDEYPEQVRKLCLLGATDKEIADFFNVSVATLYNWRESKPEFLEATIQGKKIADANVAERLYERAIGYEHDDMHVSSYQGDVTLTPIRKYYPPDTQAASLWLRNRQSDKWRDKVDHELSGKDGGPIETNDVGNTELARRIAFVLAAGMQNIKDEENNG